MLIACRSCVVWTELVQHPLDRTAIDQRFRISLAADVFFVQHARPPDPGECSLNNPATRHDFKGMLIGMFTHHLQRHTVGLFDGADQLGVATTDPAAPDRGTTLRHDAQHIPGTIPVTDSCGMHDHREQIALRINGGWFPNAL